MEGDGVEGKWLEMDESGWRWVELGGVGGKWLDVLVSGWRWVGWVELGESG